MSGDWWLQGLYYGIKLDMYWTVLPEVSYLVQFCPTVSMPSRIGEQTRAATSVGYEHSGEDIIVEDIIVVLCNNITCNPSVA